MKNVGSKDLTGISDLVLRQSSGNFMLKPLAEKMATEKVDFLENAELDK